MLRRILTIIGAVMLLSVTVMLSAQDEDTQGWTVVLRNYAQERIFVYSSVTDEVRLVADLPEAEVSITFLSPDSRHLVYLSRGFLPDATDADDYAGPRPTDIYLLDLASGDSTLIAGQPDGVTSLALGIVREGVRWSPDSSQFAWTEGFEEGRLYVADVATGEVRLIRDDIPPQTRVPNPVYIDAWTDYGIMIGRYDMRNDLSDPLVALDFYALDGSVTSIPFPFETFLTYHTIQTAAGEQVAVFERGNWWLLNPTTPEAPPQPLTQGIITSAIPGNPNSLLVGQRVMLDSLSSQYNIYTRDGALVDTIGDSSMGNILVLGVADGETFFVSANTPNTELLYRPDTGFIEIPTEPQTSVLTPGGFAYALVGDAEPVIGRSYCAGAEIPLSHRMLVPTGYVLPGGSNNIRSTPNLNGELVGQIPEGAWFNVLGNLECSDGITWVHVSYGDIGGWTAEGADGVYFIAPGCPEGGCEVAAQG